MANTIKMFRDEPQTPNGPTLADVHPDEVVEWQKYGWRVVEDNQVEPSKEIETEVKRRGRSAKQ